MDSGLSTTIVSGRLLLKSLSAGMLSGYPKQLEGRLLQICQAVFDIVCNRETELLDDARAAGAIALDGVMMLVYQGAKDLEIWTG